MHLRFIVFQKEHATSKIQQVHNSRYPTSTHQYQCFYGATITDMHVSRQIRDYLFFVFVSRLSLFFIFSVSVGNKNGMAIDKKDSGELSNLFTRIMTSKFSEKRLVAN